MQTPTLPPIPFGDDLWQKLQKTEKPIIVYGMGNGADKLIARLASIGKEVSDFFASDGFVRGQSFHGKKVLTLAEIKEKYPDFLILVSFGSTLKDVLCAVFALEAEHEIYIPDMPLAGDSYFTAAFYEENYLLIEKVYSRLQDDLSKTIFAKLLWYKLTGKPIYLKEACAQDDVYKLLDFAHMQSAVDVGAYRGDTLRELCEMAPCLQHAIAIEPDFKNYQRLLTFAGSIEGKEIETVHAAAWCENGELSFAASGNRNATLGGDREQTANTASYQHKVTSVKTVKVDDLVQERRVDYIKYDTEGAEKEALLGSLQTVRRMHPFLRVSIYHRSEDIFFLPSFLMEKTQDAYDYYIRRRLCIPAWECDLIAVPKTRSFQSGRDENA